MNESEFKDIAREIRLAVFDVDGVFTDGSLYFGEHGEALKRFNVKDGHGIKLLHQAGIVCAIISGRSSPIVSLRMAELGVDHVFQGCQDKLPFLEALAKDLGVTAAQILYCGDDTPDLPAMAFAGLAVTVADAHPDVIDQADWCTAAPGGAGAVREIADLLLHARC